MFTFKFDLESQLDRYNEVKDKIKNKDFYQQLNFYVLPFMPEKFRGRVVFLPEKFEPELIFKKQKIKIQKLERDFNEIKDGFNQNLKEFFPEVDKLEIVISPSLYGTVGSYSITDDKIFIYPRYDRSNIGMQKLVINSLVSYYNQKMSWIKIQELTSTIQDHFYPNKKSFIKILDTEFAGHLAEESAKYLEKLKSPSKFEVDKPENLTRSEKNVLNLLLRNKNKLVTFDQIAEEVWREKAYEKYSEYAITTIIKKIKKKLKQKTDKHIIQAQRSVGYILHT